LFAHTRLFMWVRTLKARCSALQGAPRLSVSAGRPRARRAARRPHRSPSSPHTPDPSCGLWRPAPAARAQVAAVVGAIKAHPNERLDVVLSRGGAELRVPVTPVPGRDGRGAIGISLYSNNYIKHTRPDSLAGV
jgi:hypothetical protein